MDFSEACWQEEEWTKEEPIKFRVWIKGSQKVKSSGGAGSGECAPQNCHSVQLFNAIIQEKKPPG